MTEGPAEGAQSIRQGCPTKDPGVVVENLMMFVQNPCKAGQKANRYQWSRSVDPYEWPQKTGDWGYNPCR